MNESDAHCGCLKPEQQQQQKKKPLQTDSMFKVNLGKRTGEHQRENCRRSPRSSLSLHLASHMAVSSWCDERPFTLTEIRQTRLRHDLMLNYIANWMWKFSILSPGFASFDGFFMKVKTARKADLRPRVCTFVPLAALVAFHPNRGRRNWWKNFASTGESFTVKTRIQLTNIWRHCSHGIGTGSPSRWFNPWAEPTLTHGRGRALFRENYPRRKGTNAQSIN